MVSPLCLVCDHSTYGTRLRYNLVVDEDVKKPTKQTNLIYYISVASSLLSTKILGLLSVSLIHIHIGGWTICKFLVLILVSILILLLVKMDFILVNASLDKAFFFFIYASHLVSGVIVKPK